MEKCDAALGKGDAAALSLPASWGVGTVPFLTGQLILHQHQHRDKEGIPVPVLRGSEGDSQEEGGGTFPSAVPHEGTDWVCPKGHRDGMTGARNACSSSTLHPDMEQRQTEAASPPAPT